MKAQILEHYGLIESSPLHFVEVPDPVPQKGEVLIDIEACAICRTDLHVIENELREQLPGKQLPLSLLFKRRENLCEAAKFTGYSENGGFSEKTIALENYVYPLPDVPEAAKIAPLLCAGIIGFRALKRASLPDGGRLGVLGFGSSAHIVIQLAQHRGAEVYVITRDEKHRKFARDLGARFAGETVSELPVSLDSAILFAPVGGLVPEALQDLKTYKITGSGILIR